MRLYDHGVRFFGAPAGVIRRTLISYFNGQPISRVEMAASTTFSTLKIAAPGMIRLFDATDKDEALVAELSFNKIPGVDFALHAANQPIVLEKHEIVTYTIVDEPSANKDGESPLEHHFIAPKEAVCDAPATEPTVLESNSRESVQDILTRLRERQNTAN